MIESLGHYRILEQVGAGGMGEVFRARDTKLGRTTAIKVLPREVAGDPERRARFLHEARAAVALSHPNIATLFEVGEDGPHLFLVFEYVSGQTLRTIIGGEPMHVRRALDLAIQLADALATAHAQGIVHRDIKPDTIVVTPKGHAKILDFGLASWTAGGLARQEMASKRLTTDRGLVVGTIAYMSPEQVNGDPVDPRTDIFSLGAVLYEMLTGRPAFADRVATATVARIASATPPPPSALNRHVPPEIDAIVLRALAKSRDDRHQSAAALSAELRSLATILDIRSGDTEPPVIVTTRRPSRRGRAWIVALGLLVAIGVAGWVWGRDEARRLWWRWTGPAPSPVIAVVPFAAAADVDRAYFAEGLTEDLITRLGQTPGLKVVGRSAMRTYRGRDPREVAREVGAGTVIAGSVRRDGGEVRVTVELLDPGTGIRIWGGQYAGDLGRVFAVQTEIAEQVARELRIALEPSTARARKKSHLVDAEAYDLYARARAAAARRDLAQAIMLYKRAIAADPSLAEAQAGLADALYGESLTSGAFGDPAVLKQVRQAAESAAQIDPELPQAQLALGLAAPTLADALRHLRRSVEIDPGYAEGYHQIGDQIFGLDPAEALRFYETSRSLDVRLDANYRDAADAHFALGRVEQAEQEVAKGRALDPDRLWHKELEARIRFARGEYEAGLALIGGDRRRETDVNVWLIHVAALHAAGRADAALAEGRRLVERYPSFCAARAVLAGLLLETGSRNEAGRLAVAIADEAARPEAAAVSVRCAALAAASMRDPERTADWLRRVAGDEPALRQWRFSTLGSSVNQTLNRQWFPWTRVADHPAVLGAAQAIAQSVSRLEAEARAVLAGLLE